MATNRLASIESNFVSLKSVVEFIDVLDQYSYNEDLHCIIKFHDYTPQEGDRIAIFKLGWNFVKDYIAFEWAPVGSRKMEHSVTFNKHLLPKNDTEMYQICYISSENVLHGASSPFLFSAEMVPSKILSIMSVAPTEELHAKQEILNSQDELKKLREENEMLKASLKIVLAHKNEVFKNYDGDINDLKDITNNLKASLFRQQKESLKIALAQKNKPCCKNYDADISDLREKIKNLETSLSEQKMIIEELKNKKTYEYFKMLDIKLQAELDQSKNKESDMPDIPPDLPLADIEFNIKDLKPIPPFPFPL